jgi:hypothetical protein
MKTLILHGPDITDERANGILANLTKVNGPLEFKLVKISERPDGGQGEVSLASLFAVCDRYRKSAKPAETDFVIFITDRPNENNFYASLDPENTRNGFVHSGEWETYIRCDSNIPVAFTILNLVIAWHTSPRFEDMYDTLHHRPIGCANDLCYQKRDVIFKLRTGDVCVDCIGKMQANNWSDLRIDHALRILEHLSKGMRYKQFFRPVIKESRMVVDMDKAMVTLPDYEGVRINISPLDLAFYLLFLKRTGGNGLAFEDLGKPEILKELLDYYHKLKPLSEREELKFTADLIGNVTNKSRHERRTGVKNAFVSALGERLAEPYILVGKRAKPMKISLPVDKIMVKWEKVPFKFEL